MKSARPAVKIGASFIPTPNAARRRGHVSPRE
jgi:hypothetical protein